MLLSPHLFLVYNLQSQKFEFLSVLCHCQLKLRPTERRVGAIMLFLLNVLLVVLTIFQLPPTSYGDDSTAASQGAGQYF